MQTNKHIIQSLLITAAFAAVLVLYFYGNTTPRLDTSSKAEKNRQNQSENSTMASSSIDVSKVESQSVQALSEEEKKNWEEFKNQNDLLSLSDFWYQKKNYLLSSSYAFDFAKKDQSPMSWNFSGDRSVEAYRSASNEDQSNALIEQAIESYNQALHLEASNELKMKLALLKTSVTGDIMGGVALLQEIIADDPHHLQANYELGVLSIQSGQNDKAIERFNTLIQVKPDFIEPYIFKAQLQFEAGNKEEASKTIDEAMLKTSDKEGLEALQKIKKEINN